MKKSNYYLKEDQDVWVVVTVSTNKVMASISKVVPNSEGYARYILKELQDTEY